MKRKSLDEYPLHIDDPADGKRKLIGMKQIAQDGSVIWTKKVGAEHVMRLGSLGFDATTYETQFRGRRGGFKVIAGDSTYVVSMTVFDARHTEADYGHGRQVFLPLALWTKVGAAVPTPKLTFGESRICPDCDGTGVRKLDLCPTCKGAKVVS